MSYRKRTMKERKRITRTNNSPRSLPRSDTNIFRTRYTVSDPVSDSKTGITEGWLSPSIQNAPEYSTLIDLYAECRLLKFRLIITPRQATASSIAQGAIYFSSNFSQNQNTSPTVTLTNLLQQPGLKTFSTSSIHPLQYNMNVKYNLQFTPISGDAPNPATPYAGSPGIVMFSSDALTVSTHYFSITVEAIYQLRNRV